MNLKEIKEGYMRGCEVEREERNDVIILYSQKETLNTS